MAASQTSDPAVLPRRSHVAHAWLTALSYDVLNSEAARRGQHPDQLAAAIVEAVIMGVYVDALLDRK